MRRMTNLVSLLLVLITLGVGPAVGADQPTTDALSSWHDGAAKQAIVAFVAKVTDVSRADAASEVIARTRIESPGLPPIRFIIAYDPGRIGAGKRYAVRARITRGEQLLFTTDTQYPVLAQPKRTTSMLLRESVQLLRLLSEGGLPRRLLGPNFKGISPPFRSRFIIVGWHQGFSGSILDDEGAEIP